MKKINSKQTGNSVLSSSQTVAAVGLVAVWMCAVIASAMIGLSTYTIILIMAISGGSISVIFFKCVMDRTEFYRITTKWKYMLRKHRDKTIIRTFVLPLKQLKKHIPIERVHDDGLIEYSRKLYGVAFRYDPPPVPKSELGVFHKQMEYVANSFGAGVEASFHFYDMIDHGNPLADSILRSINTKGKTLEQKKHLHGMYEKATQNDEPFVETDYLLAIKLGKFDSVEHAMVAYRSTVPGVMKAFREHAIYTIQLTGENEIAIAFKQFAVMEKYQ